MCRTYRLYRFELTVIRRAGRMIGVTSIAQGLLTGFISYHYDTYTVKPFSITKVKLIDIYLDRRNWSLESCVR